MHHAPKRTQVGIIGAGPAGLVLSHLLARHGIDSVVLEARARAYVENRIRAGVLEQTTVDLLRALGLAGRLERIAEDHPGVVLRIGGADTVIDLRALTGRSVSVYSQHLLVQDLIAARLAAGAPLYFDAPAYAIDGLNEAQPVIRYRAAGEDRTLACDIVAGCDGFHGISRAAIPATALRVIEQTYPFAWLGILAEAPPAPDIVYARHAEGFALASRRSDQVGRLYLQCPPDTDPASWEDARIWDALSARLAVPGGPALARGPILQKTLTPLRSAVAEPMRHGRLFLLGDAAHIVPPTGAKGLNLAVADVAVLGAALADFFAAGSTGGLDAYSDRALARIWRVQRFSWWMTTMLHPVPGRDGFTERLHAAELAQLLESEASQRALAENYVGLPLQAAL
ncbi:MAG: 4-hydroxybenzoate 3-monooxygenase [Rhodospirillales bacterium]|nr:4-hydroxybenzoate 3-monooxygenase [Rhodospirillales bacterium]